MTPDFDSGEAKFRRDRAIDHAERGSQAWVDRAISAVRSIARQKAYFTTDDLWAVCDPPAEPRAAGPLMKRAQALGLCEPTDRTRTSERVRCHARPLRVWRSRLISRGAEGE